MDVLCASFSYIILLRQQVMILCWDNVPLPKYYNYIGQYVTVLDRNQTLFCLCILITVPHLKNCSEVSFFSLNEVSGKHVVIGEVFPRLSDSCGICFYVENTGFPVSGSKARRMKNISK